MIYTYKILPLLILLLFNDSQINNATSYQSLVTAYTGATIIDGNGGTPVRDGILLVTNGRVVAAGSKQSVKIPSGAVIKDLRGKTIVPGIINAHGHVGEVKGIDNGFYSTQNIVDNLSIYARFGVTTVISLGNDRKEAIPLRAVNDPNAFDRARLFIAGDIVNGPTTSDALQVLDKNVQMGVDFIKIRIDDQLGTATKMPEEIYRAVIKQSHELKYLVAAHLYYREDARKLIDGGADILAHSIRDLPVDDAIIRMMREKHTGYIPTFTRELSTFVYEDTAAFFSDPFFTREYSFEVYKPLLDPAKQAQVKNSKAAQTYKKQLPVAYANLKKLHDQGIIVIFGTDSGVATRFIGYFEHLEMEMMTEAGLTPMQIIVSASKNAAESFGLKDLGTLTPGHYADFIILDANPLENIKNMRRISEVYIGGRAVNR